MIFWTRILLGSLLALTLVAPDHPARPAHAHTAADPATTLWATETGGLPAFLDGEITKVDAASGKQTVVVHSMLDQVDSVIPYTTTPDILAFVSVKGYYKGKKNVGALLLADITLGTWSVVASGPQWWGASDMAWAPDGRTLIVSCTTAGHLEQYDTISHTGRKWGNTRGPAGLVYRQNGSTMELWVADQARMSLRQLNAKTGALVQEYPLSLKIDGLTYDASSGLFYLGVGSNVLTFDPATQSTRTVVSGYTYFDGLSNDGGGNIFAVDQNGLGILDLPTANPELPTLVTGSPTDGEIWDDVVAAQSGS